MRSSVRHAPQLPTISLHLRSTSIPCNSTQWVKSRRRPHGAHHPRLQLRPTTLHTRSQAAHSPSGPRPLTSPLRIVSTLRRAHKSSQVCPLLLHRHSTARVPTAPGALEDSWPADALPRFQCVAMAARRALRSARAMARHARLDSRGAPLPTAMSLISAPWQPFLARTFGYQHDRSLTRV